jgi:hypothetical protein
MTNGKGTKLGTGQTHQPGLFVASEEEASATDSKSVDAEVWRVPSAGLSLYSISQGNQRKDGHSGKWGGVYCQAAPYTDQADKAIISSEGTIHQQSGPYGAGRIFSKAGSCQKRSDKLRCHLPMTGCGSESSLRCIIFLFQPKDRLFCLNKILIK